MALILLSSSSSQCTFRAVLCPSLVTSMSIRNELRLEINIYFTETAVKCSLVLTFNTLHENKKTPLISCDSDLYYSCHCSYHSYRLLNCLLHAKHCITHLGALTIYECGLALACVRDPPKVIKQ